MSKIHPSVWGSRTSGINCSSQPWLLETESQPLGQPDPKQTSLSLKLIISFQFHLRFSLFCLLSLFQDQPREDCWTTGISGQGVGAFCCWRCSRTGSGKALSLLFAAVAFIMHYKSNSAGSGLGFVQPSSVP